MLVGKFDLYNALLFSRELTPEIKELREYLEKNMETIKDGVKIELVIKAEQ